MSEAANKLPFEPLSLAGKVKWGALAVASFHLAYEFAACAPLIVVFLFSVFRLAHVATRPQATTVGIAVGMLAYGPQLGFFWTIFGPGAIALWFVLAFWLALYLALQRFALVKLGRVWGALMAPLLWTGLEYFRSELYYLRFSWLNVGYVFAPFQDVALLGQLGMYGVGFVLMLLATHLARWRTTGWTVTACVIALVAFLAPAMSHRPPSGQLPIAGLQMEFEPSLAVVEGLNKLIAKNPEAELIVLSEYTFDGPVPKVVKDWCAKHRRHLVAGGRDFLDATQTEFRNTAFVIGPDGAEVIKQVKAVPIQFFKDGLPASEQKLWESPWGKLGICICYDLSYTRVTDELIRQGAQAIITPTMDVEHWGGRQHRLHARVAPVRAAEYGVPIFRLCSSGISQAVDRHGRVIASAPYPGPGEIMAASLSLPRSGGHRPLDRFLVWPCVASATLLLGWHLLDAWQHRRWLRFTPHFASPTPQS